jgi:dTMP kinase
MSIPLGRGFFFTFEGIDKSGKSTQVELLRRRLLGCHLPVGYTGTPRDTLREPGGTPVGEEIRGLLLHRRHEIDPWAEALLYAAARAQLVAAVLRPSLDEGFIVLLDRYIDSSLAYQGHARGLGIDRVLELNRWATGGLLPDMTFLLDLDAHAASARQQDAPPDRIEREGLELQERVAEGYREVARRFPARVQVIDASREPEAIAAEIDGRVQALLEVSCV